MGNKVCVNCGRVLTKEEMEYYHDHCERCEDEMHQALMEEMLKVE